MSKVIEDFSDVMKTYNPSNNLSRNVLSRYEKTKVIGMRLEQLARGAQPMVHVDKSKITGIRDIVMMELEQKKLPFLIARTLPNGLKEYWRLSDMIILD
jgi:DNA-directed RNA polymerase subunit K/omega